MFTITIWHRIPSHSPGGPGIFDPTLILGLGAAGRTDGLAAIALYRVIYTVIPASIALSGLIIARLVSHRDILRATATVSKQTLSLTKTVYVTALMLDLLAGFSWGPAALLCILLLTPHLKSREKRLPQIPIPDRIVTLNQSAK